MRAAQEMQVAAQRKLVDFCKEGIADINKDSYLGEFSMYFYKKEGGKYFVADFRSFYGQRGIRQDQIPWNGFSEDSLLSVASEIERSRGVRA